MSVSLQAYNHFLILQFHHLTYGAVVIVPFICLVLVIVLYEHDLRAFFEFENFGIGICFRVEIPLHFTLVETTPALYFGKPFIVYRLGLSVVRTEYHAAFVLLIQYIGNVSAVEFLYDVMRNAVVPDTVQYIDEGFVRLAVDVLEFYGIKLGSLPCVRGKEIRRCIVLRKQIPFLLHRNGRQLTQIPDQQQLYTTESLVSVPVTYFSQNEVHLIQNIRPHHGDFVYHKQIQTAYDVDFLLAETFLLRPATRNVWCKGELKEGMYRLPFGIQGSYARGSKNDKTLMQTCFQTFKKGGFTRACLSRKKDIPVGLLHIPASQIELYIGFHSLHIKKRQIPSKQNLPENI